MADGTLIFDTKVDSEGLSTGLSKISSGVGKAMTGVATAAAAVGTATVAATSALVNQAKETAAFGDNIDKMSQKIGISAEAFQEWDYVFSQNGADINILETGMKTLSSAVADAGNGTTSAQEKFEMLGLSFEELGQMSQEDMFGAVIAQLQTMPEGAERTALAADLLGKSAMELGPLLNQTADDTQALKDQAKELGMVMSNEAVKNSAALTDAMDNLQRAFTGAKNSIGGEMLPALTDVCNGLALLVSGSEEGSDLIVQGSKTFEVWEGKNRTEDQSDNNPVIFSTRYGNIKEPNVLIDSSTYRSAHVVVNTTTTDNVTTNYIQVGIEPSDEPNMDAFLYLKSSAKKDDYSSMSDFYNAMQAEGNEERSASWIRTINVTFDSMEGSYEYMQDFDLGDVCNIEIPEIGISAEARLIGCYEVVKDGVWSMSMEFGTPILKK